MSISKCDYCKKEKATRIAVRTRYGINIKGVLCVRSFIFSSKDFFAGIRMLNGISLIGVVGNVL